MRIVTVIGNRPQFIKAAGVAAPSSEAPRRADHPHRTALRRRPLAGLLRGLDIPAPDRELAVGSRTNTAQTARQLAASAGLRTAAPELVLVYGDTNSTLAGALCGAQLHIPVAHVRRCALVRPAHAGAERLLTDRVSSLLLCSTDTAMTNLAREAAPGERHLVGDVMADVSIAARGSRSAAPAPSKTVSSNRRLPAGDRAPRGWHRRARAADPAGGASGGASWASCRFTWTRARLEDAA